MFHTLLYCLATISGFIACRFYVNKNNGKLRVILHRLFGCQSISLFLVATSTYKFPISCELLNMIRTVVTFPTLIMYLLFAIYVIKHER